MDQRAREPAPRRARANPWLAMVLTHTVRLRMSPAQAETRFRTADADQWAGAGVLRLAALAPKFLLTRPRDDLRFMLDAYITAIERPSQKP